MRQKTLLAIALVLLLVSFPLIALGTGDAPAALWWLGLATLVAGGALPPIARFVADDD